MRIDVTDAASWGISSRNALTDSGEGTYIPTSDGPKPNTDKNNSQMTGLGMKELPISEKSFIDAVERANKAISISNRQLEFSIHEKTKQIMVKVIDLDTKEVIREIPPEKILDMVAQMWEMAGILVDERR